ncbi:MAG: DNA recombination protein RmuC [Puniceicoccales bacterium]|jgi:DNA recombination protein RmuC|nr:DNA recombination protein RmuC [Puniceicoccales bacterium]
MTSALFFTLGILAGALASFALFYFLAKGVLAESGKLKKKLEDKESEFLRLSTQNAQLETKLSAKAEETKQWELDRATKESLSTENAGLKAERESQLERLSTKDLEIKRKIAEVEKEKEAGRELQRRIDALTAQAATLRANNNAFAEKLETQKHEIGEMQKTARLEFEKVATGILEEKTKKFTDANKESLGGILRPFQEDINLFKQKVQETYEKENDARARLGEQVKNLVEQTNKVSAEANNLAVALKGQTKKQGDWGEMLLEGLLQNVGFAKDIQYIAQGNVKTEDGKNKRPDVVIKLPDERFIVIDSKVSLVDYAQFSSADTDDERNAALDRHLRSVKRHIDELSEQNYPSLFAGSPSFTFMFIPIEPAYFVAIQREPELWNYAYSRKIVLATPSNLLACLKIVEDIWRQDKRLKSEKEIIRLAESMYNKFAGFVSNMEDVGKNLRRAAFSHDAAFGQLSTGPGNLVSTAEKIKKLGLKVNKSLPDALASHADDTDKDTDEKDEKDEKNEKGNKEETLFDLASEPEESEKPQITQNTQI